MTDMRLIGAHERAKQAKSALVRLRREIEAGLPPNSYKPYEIPGAVDEVAECLGVLRGIMDVLDECMPADMPGRENFAQILSFYRDLHKVAR